jgi:hypothetical protein
MPSRALWLRALIGAFVLGGLLGPAMAQEKKRTRMVVKYLGHQDDGKHRYQGKPVMLLGVEPLEGGRPVELVVPNKDMNGDKYDPIPQVAETVRDLKRGDIIKIELDDAKPRPYVREAKRYKLKPGESDPRTYVFENTFRKEEGRSTYTAVVLSRFDEPITVAVQQKRDKEGDMSSDVAILELLQKLKTDELVEAEIKEGGRTPVLTSLERYAPPQNGKFVKLAEQDVEGQKAPAVELEREGKPVTALVAGKMQGKRWVADAKVLAAAKKLKPDAEVVFRARDDDGRLWLKEIEPAKAQADGAAPAPRATASREHGGRDGAARDGEARGGKEKESDNRRGRRADK